MAFYSLNKGEKKRIEDDFMCAYSPVCKAFNEFVFENNHIQNSFNKEFSGWDHISILTKNRFSSGTTAVAKCSFKSYGAPAVVITDDIFIDKNGKFIYGHYYEVVVYENGVNIWSVQPYPKRLERPIMPTKIGFLNFPVMADSEFELEVKIEKNLIIVKTCNHILEASDNNIPEKFHVGITACEGENKFYEFNLMP